MDTCTRSAWCWVNDRMSPDASTQRRKGAKAQRRRESTVIAATEKYWEHFSHGADIGVRGFGASKDEAFEQAALALVAVVTDPQKVTPQDAAEISCEALDAELLLADWLNELVYAMATRKILFCRFEVRIDGHRLQATAWGERVNIARHQPAVEVKGATYTNLLVAQDPTGAWVAQCVVDV